MWRYLKRLLIGKPLKTADEGGQSLTNLKHWLCFLLMRCLRWHTGLNR